MLRIMPLFAFLALAGCYAYAPAAGPTPVGADVEVELTDAGSAGLAPLVGPYVVSIRGRTTEVGVDTLHLVVESILKRRGTDELWSKEPLAISREHISSVTTRKLSVARTSLFALTVIGGGLVVGTVIDGVTGGDPGKPKLPGQ